jgi:flavin-dependent dehydrogenase
LNARSIHSVTLSTAQRRARIRVPTIASVSRVALDNALVAAARQQGAGFLPETRACLLRSESTGRRLQLTNDRGERLEVEASVVLAADGIAGDLLRHEPGAAMRIWPRSRIGIGLWLPEGGDDFERDTIYMGCARHGYLGVVRTEGNSLDLAAAVDRSFVQQMGGPAPAALNMLGETRLPALPGLEVKSWRATPALTRRRQPCAFRRVFAIGDAASYVEPFTGDGIAWAMWSAIAVTPLAIRASYQWRDEMIDQWSRLHRNLFGQRQRISRWLAIALRHARARRLGVAALSKAPLLAQPIVRFMHPVHHRRHCQA